MSGEESWICFKSFSNRGAAEILCARLEVEGVPARLEVDDFEAGFRVLVPEKQVREARRIASRAQGQSGET